MAYKHNDADYPIKQKLIIRDEKWMVTGCTFYADDEYSGKNAYTDKIAIQQLLGDSPSSYRLSGKDIFKTKAELRSIAKKVNDWPRE